MISFSQPTSGLDARAALLVVKTLRAIADEGRTVVATIHQPSGAVFEMFVSCDFVWLSGHVE
jgi:ABC-type multidrug transport system ATPase subunit